MPNRGLLGDAAHIASVVRGVDCPVVLVGHSHGGAVTVAVEKFPEAVAADVDPDLAAVLAVSQRPPAGLAFAEKATATAWKTKPAWAVVSSSDTTINPDLERVGYRRAKIDFVEIDSSHMVLLSHPDEVVGVNLKAVEATGQYIRNGAVRIPAQGL